MSENRELVTTGTQARAMARQLPVATPAVDIYENEAEILLHADLPGVLKDDISVHIDNGKLTLSGVRRLEESGATAWREFGEAEYRRTFSVPQSIDINKVHAELRDGVLRLHLPKSEAARPRQIEIRAE